MSSALDRPAFEVSPGRLASGRWCHRTNKMIGKGDIAASYSADRIGSEMPVRRPFSHEARQWVCIEADGQSGRAYSLVHAASFEDPTFTHGQRVREGRKGRSDPKGFYHGMLVKHRGETMVLRGPEARFVEGIERQGDLFGF